MVLRFVVDVHTTCFGLHGHGNMATKAAKQIPSGLKSKISYTPEEQQKQRSRFLQD
jgi:hypothetical protein